ncbi:MAG: DUF177 domain-containing protein [Acidobacteria bacterium]|nr:MAG: DUF177 domain-containing protein [Acidobacteriota bacterium]
MKIRLDRLGDEPFTWQETLELPRDRLARDEVVALGSVACSGRILKLPEGFLLRAELTYEQTLACMRCLRPLATPVDCRFELALVIDPAAATPSAGERELESDELGVLHLHGPAFDTEPVLIEQLQLNVPMKPLCRDDCAGLCGTCGADLNDGPCGCGAPADPRWSGLAALRDRLTE